MRNIALTALAAALCSAALPAAARDTQPRPAASDQQAGRADGASNPDRRVCIIDRLSNSRIPRRVCKTAREWQLENDWVDDR
jgi:hypothetical protein